MNDIVFFFSVMSWIVSSMLFVLGLLAGSAGALILGPGAYRFSRRRALRRDWRRDRPQRVVESLTPQWDDYDPDLVGVGRRCICHSRQLHPGEHVLLWPETGPLGILHIAVYCETVKERL